MSSSCPVKISPPTAIVRFGDPLWANCTALTEQVQGMGWESSQGGRPLTAGVSSLALNIESVTVWGLSSTCFINSLDGGQCTRPLPVTVYSKFCSKVAFFVLSHLLLMILILLKDCGISCSLFHPTEMPDKVSMSGHAGPLVQDQKYEMHCDVFNVAPVEKLLVHWYKGNTIVSTQIFNEPTVYPVNISSNVTLLADREDHGSLIWCEAAMNFWLGTDRPASQSQAYKMEVLCMFLTPSYLKYCSQLPFLFVLLYLNNSSSLLSSSNLP